MRGKLISLMTESERTLFFDLLPVELGKFRGYQVRLHLCTVPGQIAHDRTRQLVLRHVDGVVFVVDSQETRVDDDVESIRNLEDNLRRQGDDPDTLPLVIQYNKRDLPEALPVEELHRILHVPPGVHEIEAVAVRGTGVFETLKAITRECLALVGDPARIREGRSPSVLPGRRASMYPPSDRPSAVPRSQPAETSEGSGASPVMPKNPSVPYFEEDEDAEKEPGPSGTGTGSG
jgi:signal recognition particle receptor subunit beta